MPKVCGAVGAVNVSQVGTYVPRGRPPPHRQPRLPVDENAALSPVLSQ